MIWSLHQYQHLIVDSFYKGDIFIYPTEAVYGLGGDPGNTQAVEKILMIKQRSADKGLIMVAGDWSQTVGWITELSPLDKQEMEYYMAEQPTTFVLPAGNKVSPSMKDTKTGRIALRISKHPVIVELSKLFGQPLISTSANFSGVSAARTLQQARNYFPNLPIIEGELGGYAAPSRVIDWQSKTVVRTMA